MFRNYRRKKLSHLDYNEGCEYDDELAPCSSWVEYWLVVIPIVGLAIGIPILAYCWLSNYRSGFTYIPGTTSNVYAMTNYHAFWNTFTFCICAGIVCCIFRLCWLLSYYTRLVIHIIMCIPIFPAYGFGLQDWVQFRNQSGKPQPASWTVHSTVGKMALLCWIIQIVLGIIFMTTSKRIKKWFRFHAATGIGALIVNAVAIHTGYIVRVYTDFGKAYAQKGSETYYVNFLLLAMTIFFFLVIYILVRKEFAGFFAAIVPDDEY